MSPPARFQINPQVVNEMIQGEVVAIDLESGCYYSLTGVAAEVWTLLQQHVATDELINLLRTRYDAAAGEIETAIASFVDSLQSEGLIVPAADSAPGLLPASVTDHAAAGGPFVAPVLQKYSDMQDLLLIDPIHEVGEAGWPVKVPKQKLEP